MSEREPVVLDGASLTPDDVARVARDDARVTIAESAREAVRESRERVEEVIESGEAVYGLNTGFGQLVTERIPESERERLQRTSSGATPRAWTANSTVRKYER